MIIESPYLDMIFIPRIGKYMIIRGDVNSFKNKCKKVGMATNHIGFSSTGKSEKLYITIENKSKYEKSINENVRRENENEKIFEKRKKTNNTLEYLFA